MSHNPIFGHLLSKNVTQPVKRVSFVYYINFIIRTSMSRLLGFYDAVTFYSVASHCPLLIISNVLVSNELMRISIN